MPATLRFLSGWLNGEMLAICTNSPEPVPFCAGGTAREANSLPYKSVCRNLTAKFQFEFP